MERPDGRAPAMFEIPPAAIDSLRVALATDERERAAQLRVTAEHCVASARKSGLRAEELIVAFKRAWHTRPEIANHPNRMAARSVLSELVSACITEYYRDAPPRRVRPRPDDSGAQ
jgi:hypothetical protein